MNNIEKKLKKRGIQKLKKYAKNPYHVAWFKRIPTWMKVAIPSLAVATATAVVCFAVILPMVGTKNYSANLKQGENVPSNAQASSGKNMSSMMMDPADNSGAYVKNWEEKTLEEKYTAFTYTIDDQGSGYRWYHHNPIEAQSIGDKLADDVVITGYYPYEDVNHQTTVSIYKVKDFAPRLILAVKFSDDEHYYCYGNMNGVESYQTLGDLLADLPLDKIATFDKAYFGYSEGNTLVSDEYSGVTKESVMNILLADTSKQDIANVEPSIVAAGKDYTKVIQISTPFPSIDITSGTGASALTICDTGFLQATMLNRHYNFYIGVETYQNFENYLTSNLMGTRQSSYYPFSKPFTSR